jgi:hypothetical protein
VRDTTATVDAVCRAVQRMAGTKWIDIETGVFPPVCPGWVTLYPPRRCLTPDTPVWQQRRQEGQGAMVAVVAPF